MPTPQDILAELKKLKVRRAIVGEYKSFLVIGMSPRKRADAVKARMLHIMPAGTSVVMRRLPIWKCWFKRYQYVTWALDEL